MARHLGWQLSRRHSLAVTIVQRCVMRLGPGVMTSSGGEGGSRGERLSRGHQEILRVEATMPRTARSGGVSGMLHRTTVRRADLIEGTVDSRKKQEGNARLVGKIFFSLTLRDPAQTFKL